MDTVRLVYTKGIHSETWEFESFQSVFPKATSVLGDIWYEID